MQAKSSTSKPKLSLRLSDLHKLMKARYGGPCRTEDALRYLQAAIPELIRPARSWHYALAWARDWTPALVEEHGEDFVRHEWLKVSACETPNLPTDQLSTLLAVADDEPARLDLRCIPAASRPEDIRLAERRAKNAKAQAARRAAKPGHRPRSESDAATKPWAELGMSRSYWYARERAERLAAKAGPEIQAVDDFVGTVSLTPSIPAVDDFVVTVSVSASAPPCAPSGGTPWTTSWTPFLQAPQVATGQEAPAPAVPANDRVEALAFEEDGFRGANITLRPSQIQAVRERYPELDAGIVGHLVAVDALMGKTPAFNHVRVARNLLADIGRKARRSMKAANTNERAELAA